MTPAEHLAELEPVAPRLAAKLRNLPPALLAEIFTEQKEPTT